MNLKKIMSGAAAFMMTASLMTSYPTRCFKGLVVPVSVGAEELNFCGKTENDKVYWSFDSATGTLTISGSGEINDCRPTENALANYGPWDAVSMNIKYIDVQEGITSIGEYAFAYCNGLKSVDIADSVLNVGNYAFYGCNNLESIVLPNSLIKLSDYLFQNCSNLKTISMPAGAKLGTKTFSNCVNIENVTFTSYNTYNEENVEILKEKLNNLNTNKPISYTYKGKCGDNATFTLDSQGNLVISGSGKMYDYSFPFNMSPWDSLSNIITGVIINENVTSIGNYAFYKCLSLEKVVVDAPVITIGEYAFNNCVSLKEVKFSDELINIEGFAFKSCEAIKSIKLPDSLEKIGANAFQWALNEVVIPNSVRFIDSDVFSGCSKIIIPADTQLASISTQNYVDFIFFGSCTDDKDMLESKKSLIKNQSGHELIIPSHKPDENNICEYCGNDLVSVKVNDGKGNVDSKYYIFGDSVTITAPTAETGMTFDCWLNSQNVVVSNESPYTFTATVNDTFTPKYKSAKAETMTVVWVSAYGQEMGRKEIDSSQFNIETLKTAVAIPSKLGCINGRWVLKSDSVTEFTKDAEMTFVPEYDEEEKYYTITVNDGTPVTARYKATEIATITANAPQNGMKFSHWVDQNNKIVSYSSTYKFYVSNNMTFTAVYVEDETAVEKMGTADIVNTSYDINTKKASFVAQLTIPDGCKILQGGLVATNKFEIKDNLTSKNAEYIKGGTNLTCVSYRYTWTKTKVEVGYTWYVRAYLKYQNIDGEIVEKYGDLVEYTAK